MNTITNTGWGTADNSTGTWTIHNDIWNKKITLAPEEHYCDQCEEKHSLEDINYLAKLGMGAIIYITDIVKRILMCPKCLNMLVKYIPGVHRLKTSINYYRIGTRTPTTTGKKYTTTDWTTTTSGTQWSTP